MSKPHLSTLTVPANQPRAAVRHSKIQQVFNDIYMVRGKMPSTPSRPLFERLFMYYSRTMTIVQSKNDSGVNELTLINTIRLNEKTLESLSMLGEIKHIVRLGSFHGVDDAYYVQRYQAKYWVVDGMINAQGLNVTPDVLSSKHLPIPNAELFNFDQLPYPEAILVLPKTQHRLGVAITTDSIQNHRTVFDIDNSPLVSFAIWKIGLAGIARLGPIWLREQTPLIDENRDSSGTDKERDMITHFKPQFERLLSDFSFDALLPGHGWPIKSEAKVAIQASIDSQLNLK